MVCTTALPGRMSAAGRERNRPLTPVRCFPETGLAGGWKSLSRQQLLPAYSGQDTLANRRNGGR